MKTPHPFGDSTPADQKLSAPSKTILVRNKSQQIGFYGGNRIRPGMTFRIGADPAEFSSKWMERIDAAAGAVKDDVSVKRTARLQAQARAKGQGPVPGSAQAAIAAGHNPADADVLS